LKPIFLLLYTLPPSITLSINYHSMATTGLHLVALGSSFAAGPGIQPQASPVAAGRSLRNFVNLLSQKLPGSTVTDLTVSGATLLNILVEPQVCGATTFPPQLEGLPEDADVVVILGGGNDLGYIGDMLISATGVIGRLIMWWSGPSLRKSTREEVTKRMTEVVDRVHAKAPQARILLVEYLTLLGADIRPHVQLGLTAEQIQFHQDVANSLRAVYRATAESRDWCELVEVAERSWEHGLGSECPWVEGLSFQGLLKRITPLHPNEGGMEAVADMVHKKLVSSLEGPI
jgi:lysophospholipase L1-like esterase